MGVHSAHPRGVFGGAGPMAAWVERLSAPKVRAEADLERDWNFYDTDTVLGKQSIAVSVKHSPLRYRSFSSASTLKKLSVDEIPCKERFEQARRSRVSSTDRLPDIKGLDPYGARSYKRRCEQWVRNPNRASPAYASSLPRFAQFGKRTDARFFGSGHLCRKNLSDCFRFHT